MNLLIAFLTPFFLMLADSNQKIEILEQGENLYLKTGWYYVSETENGIKRKAEVTEIIYNLNSEPIVTCNNFTELRIYESVFKIHGLMISFDEKGTEKWSTATRNSIDKKVGFVFQNNLIYTATVKSEITQGISAIEDKSYSVEELENLKERIESEIEENCP